MRITYAQLSRRLRDQDEAFEHVNHRSQALYAALGDVGAVCRSAGLPPLPALVVRADTRRPGDAYFEGMPFAYRDERFAAWQNDIQAVRATVFPRLPTKARRK